MDGGRRAAQERSNSRAYLKAARHRYYSQEHILLSEASAFIDYPQAIAKRVLELGAGAGRLAPLFQSRSSHYLATDISPTMIANLLSRHPDVNTMVLDARDLSHIQDAEFDTVFFGFNGIDSVPFVHRALILSESYRVLTPGGLFIHATHSLHHAHAASFTPGLRALLVEPISTIRRIWNRVAVGRFEHRTNEYALVNDRALLNGLLNVYADPDIHCSQLRDRGFKIEAIYDRGGRRSSAEIVPDDQWYYIVARKQGHET